MSKSPRSGRTRRAPSRRAIVNNTPQAVAGVVLTLDPPPFLEGSTLIISVTGEIGEWTADFSDIPQTALDFQATGKGDTGNWEPLVFNSATSYEDGGKSIIQLVYNWDPGTALWEVLLSVSPQQRAIRSSTGGGIAGFAPGNVQPMPAAINMLYVAGE